MSNDSNARLAEFLAIGDFAQNLPGVRIRDAATMLVIDREGPVAKVLVGKRHHGHKFMPGMFVFPGGRVERADRSMPSATSLDPRVEAQLMLRVRDPSPHKARGFALAAIRETFEETGLVLGAPRTDRDGARMSIPVIDGAPGERWAESGASRTPDVQWAQYARHGMAPDLAAVHFIARAITPPGLPRRFDTRFFAVDASVIAARIDGAVGPETELVELVWLPVEHTLQLEMPGITIAVLEELKLRTAAGFTHDLPVPFYRIWRGRRLREFLS
jgi:8-oxo-dGTP pyrophosphatase MutT (NUDIX family)